MTRNLLLAALALSCGCATTYSRGKKLAEQGRFEDASRYWMTALDEDYGAKGPRKGLDEYGAAAVWVHMETAMEHEAQRRYEAAIEEYGKALALADLLVEYEVEPNLDREELGEQITEIQDSLAAYRYDQGAAAFERGEYAAAIDWYDQARDLRPDYRDTTEQIGNAHREAGHKALRDRDYRVALTEFDAAIEWTGDAEARGWHDATAVALSRFYLRNGACRDAHGLLDDVRNTATDPELDELIARAEDCSRIEIVVLPFEEQVEENLPTADLAGTVTDAVTEQIRAGASSYVTLVDPMLADDVPNAFGKRYVVRGRLNQVVFHRPPVAEETRTVEATIKAVCPSPDGYPTYNPELCDEERELSYTVQSETVALNLVGSVRISDPRTGELLLTRSLDSRSEHTAEERSALRRGETTVEIGDEATEEVYAVPAEVRDLPTEAPRLPSDAQLIEQTSQVFGENAATAVLSAVDTVPEPQQPRSLDIRPPVVDAGQIEFAEPMHDETNPTRAVIRGGAE